MLVLALFILMTAVALPTVKISPILLTRVVLFSFVAVLSFNAMYIQAIGLDHEPYYSLYLVTSVSQSIDTLILGIAVTALIISVASLTSNVVQALFSLSAPITLSNTVIKGLFLIYIAFLTVLTLNAISFIFKDVVETQFTNCVYTYIITLDGTSSSIYQYLGLDPIALIISLGDTALTLSLLISTLKFVLLLLLKVLVVHVVLLLISYKLFMTLKQDELFGFYASALWYLRFVIVVRVLWIISLVYVNIFGTDIVLSFMYNYMSSLVDFGVEAEPILLMPWSHNVLLLPILDLTITKCFGLMFGVALCDSQPEVFIPWDNTPNLSRGITALIRMYDSLADGSDIKRYLTDNCLHLLAPLSGNTGIDIKYVDPCYLITDPNNIKLGDRNKVLYTSGLEKQAGIYIMYEEGDDNISQCGSCINYYSRLKLHYKQSLELPKDLYKSGMSVYHWNPIKVTTNYLMDFQSNVRLVSPEENMILTSFTQQEIRSLEQSVSTYAMPKFYKGILVNTWHNAWTQGQSALHPSGKFTTWTDDTGCVFTATSIAKAAELLDLSESYVSVVCNCVPEHYINSPTYGKVCISIDGSPEQIGPPTYSYGRLPNTIVDYKLLQANKIYLFTKDMIQHSGPYQYLAGAQDAMGVPRTTTMKKAINILELINAPLLGIAVYLVKSKVMIWMPAIVKNLTDGTVEEFTSINGAANATNDRQVNNFVRSYVLKGKTYTKKDGKEYLVEYVNKSDHDSQVNMYSELNKKHKATQYAKNRG